MAEAFLHLGSKISVPQNFSLFSIFFLPIRDIL